MTASEPSVQLYTVREALQADLAGTLRRLRDIGFRLVEPYDFMAFGALGAGLRSAGLTAPTTHAHFVGGDADAVFAAARELGIGTVIEPYVEPARWSSLEGVRAVAADQVAVGAGSLPIWDIIASAPDALRVIELDDTRGDRFQAIADSFAFLTAEAA